jgi:hypothetical protein
MSNPDDKPMGDPTPPNPPNIHHIDGAAAIQMLKNLEATWMVRIEVFQYQSRMLRTKYTLCLEQGFTEAQALALCPLEWR